MPLDMPVLQQPCVASGHACPTAALRCLWTCLSYSSLVLPLDMPVHCPTAALCCLWTCLSYSSLVLPLDMPVHCPTAALCCLWTCLSYSSLVLSLNVSVLQQPWLPLDVCLFYSSLCCLWMRLFYSIAVCAVPVYMSLNRGLWCPWTSLFCPPRCLSYSSGCTMYIL